MTTSASLDRLRRATPYQINVAEDWLKLGARENLESAFAFIAYYSAFNAIYWLSSSIVAATAGDWKGARSKHPGELNLPEEGERISGLIDRMGPAVAQTLLSDPGVQQTVHFLSVEREGVRDMRWRECDEDGDRVYGSDQRDTLKNTTAAPLQKVKALAAILYVVRCNLVHGSKQVSGTGPDDELLRGAIPGLRQLAEEAVAYAKALPGRLAR